MTSIPSAPPTRPAPDDRPWLESERPVEERIDLLLAEMTVGEKAGLLFHSMLPIGELDAQDPAYPAPSGRELVEKKHLTHFNLIGGASTGQEMAAWHNALQRIAAGTRLGIPVTVSTDTRHAFADNPGAGFAAGPFSQWPEPLGLAAIGDEDIVAEFANIARQEYAAVGLRVALHPQVDLATEARWSRQAATFGEDVDLVSRLVVAYIRGFHQAEFGPGSVSTITKHFPGGGPQKDGEDPHFPHGKEQVYPGDMFELHLKPFEAAFEAGARQVMPYYGKPVGTPYEEVGFSFSKGIVTGLLRERYGFQGIVCTDWAVLTDTMIFGDLHPARAWGLEHLTPSQRIRIALEAGVDQFGGESCPELLVELVRTGEVSEGRVDVSARRLLREKFELGMFEDPFVDESAADEIVGRPEFRAAGEAAQRASVTVLTNRSAGEEETPLLPLAAGAKLYVEGIDPEIAAAFGEVVGTPQDADVAILRLQAPFEERSTVFENFFHAGSLEFPEEVVEHVRQVAEAVPTVVDVFLDRPAILGPIVEAASAVTGNWGASAEALLDVLSGIAPSRGTLPFDLPSSMAAVEASRNDVPFDTAAPLFRFGHGLTVTPRPEDPHRG